MEKEFPAYTGNEALYEVSAWGSKHLIPAGSQLNLSEMKGDEITE